MGFNLAIVMVALSLNGLLDSIVYQNIGGVFIALTHLFSVLGFNEVLGNLLMFICQVISDSL